jgi:hypothetical protein
MSFRGAKGDPCEQDSTDLPRVSIVSKRSQGLLRELSAEGALCNPAGVRDAEIA